METNTNTGWAKLSKSRKFHYFENNQSVCNPKEWNFGHTENSVGIRKRCRACDAEVARRNSAFAAALREKAA